MINNPQAVHFVNEEIRTLADEMAQCYYHAKQVIDKWNANNMGTILPVSADVVDDGADVDGRPIITGNDVQVIIGNANALTDDFETDNNTKLNGVLRVSTNPLR